MSRPQDIEKIEQFLKTAKPDDLLDFIEKLVQRRPELRSLLMEKLKSRQSQE
jgi:hypothetical protein